MSKHCSFESLDGRVLEVELLAFSMILLFKRLESHEIAETDALQHTQVVEHFVPFYFTSDLSSVSMHFGREIKMDSFIGALLLFFSIH